MAQGFGARSGSGAWLQKGFSAMNFRILAAVRPRGRAFALLAATTLSASLAVTAAVAQAPAPAPKAPKAPKAAPKAPAPAAQQAPPAGAPPAQAQAPAQQPEQQIQLIYAPWTKFCLKGQEAGAKQVCFTGKDGRIESGQPVIAAVIIEPEGEPKKILRVTLPLGMQLVHGTRIIIDNNQPQQAPYVICFQNGCMSDYEATPETIAALKKGQNLVVQAINSNGAALTLPLPLANEFAKAYDGPPTDPKVFEENQKKLQEELQKRAEEARKKLEQSQAPGGAQPNPAAK
jgi:invasion protein IalB